MRSHQFDVLRSVENIRGANTIGSVSGIHVLYAGFKVNKRQMTLNQMLFRPRKPLREF